MATKRIQTQLSIKAVDQYSGKLREMRTVTGRFADGVRTEMGRLQKMRGPLKLIEDFRKQQQVVGKSGQALEQARERVRQLKHAITTTRQPSAQMRREFDRARAAAGRLEAQHQRNRRTLSGLRGQLRETGVNMGDLSGEERRLAGSIDRVTTAFGRQVERMQRVETMQKRIAEGRARMDRSLATAANLTIAGHASMQSGRRILTGLSGVVQEAVAFESSMSDVRKVVNFEAPDGFAKMSDDILTMSTHIPVAADGLAEIVAAGGQSGIATKDLSKFAEMAAKIGVAFDISADQSGESMAKIKTALGLSLDETASLFDAMNHLSNNMAATAPDVLNFTKRVAVDGAVKGFSPTQTMAFGTAMIAAGAEADVAATSFRNMGKALARGESATDRQQAAFAKLGLSSAKVAKSMQKDAVGTTIDVMEKINALPKHLQASVTSDLFGDEARALAPLINNLDLVRESVGLVSDQQNYAGSAEKEYAARAQTTANNLQLMRNQMSRLGITIGDAVLPPLNDLLKAATPIVESFTAWAKEHKPLVKWLLVGAAAVGGLAVAGGALLTAAGGLIGTMAILRFGLVGFGARAAFAAGDLLGLGGAFRGLLRLPKLALSTLITPLRWTSRLLPNFAPALARFVGFRAAASAEMAGLATSVGMQSKLIERSLSGIRWKAFSAGTMAFLAMKSLPKDPKDLAGFQAKNREGMEGLFRSLPGLGSVMGGYDWLFKKVHGTAPPVETGMNWTRPPANEGGAPEASSGRITQLKSEAEDLRAQIAGIEGQIANLGDGPMTAAMAAPFRDQLEARKSDLADVEAELKTASAAAEDTGQAISGLDDIAVSPEIDTTQLDRALDKVDQLGAGLLALPFAGTGPRPVPKPAGARATGGPVRTGLPYLVNENTPRSEWFVPSQSGGILNVSQAKDAMRTSLSSAVQRPVGRSPGLSRLHQGVQGLRAASLAMVAAAPVAAQPAATSGAVSVQIENFTVQVPSGVSDPEAIADLVSERLGQRVAATISASFSD
ncbi:tail protein [Thioclava dalianensis]|uniref:Tail protein n=1 Tax=Thioclava dalianensis TaxID=1185766 RepID=A0A074U4R1_9RHOB|nr:phage tail tape measure protein [Thioclava dalianensis]KEP69637.1 tail protein [Thioclava dalianensis]SFN16374.1 phage tail tape measure protein, TP901 family, core region [Thioclava dalianensis]